MNRPPCFNCGAESDHDHHVVPRSLGGVATVPLCGGCHGKAHGHRGLRSTRELTRAALATKRLRGECTGHPPFGLSADAHGRLTLNPEEQAVIARARGLRAAGVSWRAIAKTLSAEGIRTRAGKPHSYNSVRRMVTTASRDAHSVYQPVRVEHADFGPLFGRQS